MPVTMPRVTLIACLLSSGFLGPSLSWALGLGEIHLNSALNEPMNAEIDLIAAAPDELTALRATLASREAFTRYGIDKPPFLSTVTFKVGKAKDGRDVLLVRSTDSIPEPFVTFLVEVNWARGRLMREYTVLLDPPVYTPGESARSAAPVAAPTTSATPPATAAAPAAAAAPTAVPAPTSAAPPPPRRGAAPPSMQQTAPSPAMQAGSPDSVHVGRGDTLTKIARSLQGAAATPAAVDQTMIALFRSNREAFGGNINVLRQGTILRVPNADEIAALNQKEAIGEVRRQMDAWRTAEGAAAAPSGQLRLVAPTTGGSATGIGTANGGTSSGSGAEAQALKERVKDLEGQLAESKRLIDIRNNELSALQRKLGVPAPPPVAAPPAAKPPVAATPPRVAPATPAPAPTPPAATPPVAATPPPVEAPPAAVPASPVKKPPAVAPPESGSWTDWVADNWWVPVALLVVVLGGLGFAAMRRRRQDQSNDLNRLMEDTDIADHLDPTSKLATSRKSSDSFVVEESGEHPMPDFGAEPAARFGDTSEIRPPDDTMSSESAVNLDQGDPLAEADFHMAYGLYDQAADLVRIALEREPDRRDLRLKLLEIYFVWGNKDLFLQTAKSLEASRDRAPAGEWDKIVIMGRQICPDEPMFSSNTGSGRGAGALVDLNLEGGENRVDIDLFGDPEGERSTLDHGLAKEGDDMAATSESPSMGATSDHLDFTLDTPERGADQSPTRQMPPRDEPTVESELMNFGDANFLDAPDPDATAVDAPTTESPALRGSDRDRISSRLPPRADQTAEVSIEDLGLDLDHLEETGSSSISLENLRETDHPEDAPTMVAGLDERSRAMMAEAEKNARDRDLTELERELEASFVSDLDSNQDGIKTAVLGPESAPTVLMPRETDLSPTSRFRANDLSDVHDEPDKVDVDSTSKLRGIHSDSIDLDLDRLASALGSGDTVDQPRAVEEVFSTEVFEASQRSKQVDLDVGESMNGADSASTNSLKIQTNKLKPLDLAIPELEPVTMSEVGTKLDLARAYMDMGDPEGARSILEEVVQEGSASQKQEASRLIESLPG
jgi:pilus assembly protein FimV